MTEFNHPSSRTRDGALYLDNAATSWPKPPGVAKSMVSFLDNSSANPGRSGHRMSIEAARIVYAAREAIASLFGASDPTRVIFCLNVTDGINLALHGLLKEGEHVVTSSVEHNAVMRPLNAMQKENRISYTRVSCAQDGSLDPTGIEAAIQANTKMIVLNHASNVCGTILPIEEVGRIARKHDLIFLVDTAQSAGSIPIDMEANSIDLLCFTGHKSLYGPMGTGGLVIGSRVNSDSIATIRQGGTGSRSEKEIQPDFCPDKFESGTPNAVGLAGLLAALDWLKAIGVETLMTHKKELTAALIEGLMNIPGVRVYGPLNASKQTSTIGFNIEGMEPSTVGLRLDEEFNILCRVGLHCAPAAHKTVGTFPGGCVRFGLGAFNTIEDVNEAVQAVSELSKEVG